jgi:hydroxymethylglutaryl-CoA synthase
VLDVAEPGDRVLLVSFGSGAGSDAFDIQVTEMIRQRCNLALKTADYIARRTPIDYAEYARLRGKLTMK